MKYLGLFLFFEETFVTPKRVRNAMMIILFGSALLGIDGLFQKFSGVDFLRHKDLIPVLSSGTFGVCASFNHYNDFGAYLIVVLSLVIALSILDKFMCLDFMILLFLETLLSLCLVFTFSRGAWLGLVFSMILMMIISSKNMAKKIVFLIPVFIGIVVLVPELRERIIFTFTPKGDANRIEVWKIAITIIKENPFIGKGIGLFMDCFSKITRLNAQYAHNCYLQIWVETGIFSLLSFLGFLGLLFWNGIKRFKNNKDPVLLGLICGLFGFAVHAFFDTQLYSIQTSMLFWSLAGILSVLSTKQIEV
jgi:putative inorganic carbon (HCO3(-)) transporter